LVVGLGPDVVVETLEDEELVVVLRQLGLDDTDVTVPVHAKQIDETTAPPAEVGKRASERRRPVGTPRRQFAKRRLLHPDDAGISSQHRLQPVLVGPAGGTRLREVAAVTIVIFQLFAVRSTL
jgi:hypothetical protein